MGGELVGCKQFTKLSLIPFFTLLPQNPLKEIPLHQTRVDGLGEKSWGTAGRQTLP